MEEDGSSQKRLLLAAVVSAAIMMVWGMWFPQKQQKTVKPQIAEQTISSTSTVSQIQTAGEPEKKVQIKTDRPVPPEKKIAYAGIAQSTKGNYPYQLEVNTHGGGIDRFELPGFFERDEKTKKTNQAVSLALSKTDAQKFGFGPEANMAGVRFVGPTNFDVPSFIPFEVVEQKPDSLLLKYVTEEGIEIERAYQFSPERFEIEMAVTIRNRSNKTSKHQLAMGTAMELSKAMEKGSSWFSSFVPPADQLNLLCYTKGSVERHSADSVQKESAGFNYSESARWVATDRQYFLAALVSRDQEPVTCDLKSKDKLFRSELVFPSVQLNPGEERRHKMTAYLGVKKPELLTQVEADLENAIDYKVIGLNLAPICGALLWILGLFHGWVASWGISIFLLTVLVKSILFPLNQRQGRSMRAMQALKPEMDELRKKYANDKQRQNEEMMHMWKKHGVNPAGGCLPMLLQMPIWFALYRSLWVSVDLYQQDFMWIPDLTAKDPYFILPIVLMILMFLQQKMMPTSMDPAQQKVMLYTMPLLFGAMMIALPAGLCFYILVNTLLTIIQQQLINRGARPETGPLSIGQATPKSV